jgi:hypothetical protein
MQTLSGGSKPIPVATEQDPLLPNLESAETENGVAESDPDKPRIPGVKIQYILPALAIGVHSITTLALFYIYYISLGTDIGLQLDILICYGQHDSSIIIWCDRERT